MAIENGAAENSVTSEAATSRSPEVASVKSPAVNENEQDCNKSKGDEKVNLVPFYKLFSFADSTDILLMVVGSIGAAGNGISTPLMTVLFGTLINTFGENQTDTDVVDLVSKVNLRKYAHDGLLQKTHFSKRNSFWST